MSTGKSVLLLILFIALLSLSMGCLSVSIGKVAPGPGDEYRGAV